MIRRRLEAKSASNLKTIKPEQKQRILFLLWMEGEVIERALAYMASFTEKFWEAGKNMRKGNDDGLGIKPYTEKYVVRC